MCYKRWLSGVVAIVAVSVGTSAILAAVESAGPRGKPVASQHSTLVPGQAPKVVRLEPGKGPAREKQPPYAPNRVLVGLKADKGKDRVRDEQLLKAVEKILPGKFTRTALRTADRHIVVLELAAGQTVSDVIKQNWKARDSRIVYVEPDVYWQVQAVPNDTYFAYDQNRPLEYQWTLQNTGQNGGVAGADIHAPQGWNLQTDSSSVVVGLIDTGVDYRHPDLANNIWVNTAETAGNSVDDDGNGYVDDVRGFDFFGSWGDGQGDHDADPFDGFGHGTHCAGIIGACGNNGQGICGVAWSARVMPVKIGGPYWLGSASIIAEGIGYAVDNGAKVLSCSFGGTGYSQALYEAFAYARTHGVLVVAAAGNEGANLDSTPAYPACFDLDNILAVASTDARDGLSDFGGGWASNYGATKVGLGAPGGGVITDSQGSHHVPVWSTYPGFQVLGDDWQSVTPPWIGTVFHIEGDSNKNHWVSVTEPDSTIAISADAANPYTTGAEGYLVSQEYDLSDAHCVLFDYGFSFSINYTEGDYIGAEFWDGSAWQTLEQFAGGPAGWTSSWDLTPYRNAHFKVRFHWHTEGSSNGYAKVMYARITRNIPDNQMNEYNNVGYVGMEGTSMACPHVAGAAAQVWAHYPDLDYHMVKSWLMQTTDPLSSLAGKCVSGGRLNLYRALTGGVHNKTQGTLHTTIQGAINAAQSGDEIVVPAGTYRECINFGGKNIQLHSSNPDDPAIVSSTIIDGQGSDTVVRFAGTESAAAVLSGLTITNGSATAAAGGIHAANTYATISKCVIQNCTGVYGGGIGLANGTISDCTIQGNTAVQGGGVHGGTLRRCRILNNTATGSGGGVTNFTLVENCTIAGNHAANGGAVGFSSDMPVRNCLIVGNSATGNGGAFSGGHAVVSNCTIAGNSAGAYGGGAYSLDLDFTNCVFRDNTAGTAGAQLAIQNNQSDLFVKYCDVQGGQAGVCTNGGALGWGSGNIDADPLFHSSAGGDGNAATWADNDYHIDDSSPCINAGNAAGNYTGQTDLDGQARVLAGRVDIGVDEHTQRIYQVPSQYTTIQAAINATQLAGDEVLVADGTYTGTGNRDIEFLGKNIIVRSSNGAAACILDAQGTTTEPHRSFYLHDGEDSRAIIQGFTIRNGVQTVGGGIYCETSSPTIRDCVLQDNAVDDYGYGGAICSYDSSLSIRNCTISDNTFGDHGVGGAIATIGFGSLEIDNCTIVGNGSTTATRTAGGAIYLCGVGWHLIESTLIAGNSAEVYAGLLQVQCDLTLQNCSITGNTSTNTSGVRPGAIWIDDNSTTIANTIIYGNTTGGQIAEQITLWTNYTNPQVAVSYSDIQGGLNGFYLINDVTPGTGLTAFVTWLTGNINADPLFADPANGDYHLQAGSPCIDAGDPNGTYAGRFDIDGQPRQLGPQADIGADEYGWVLLSSDPAADTTLPKTANNVIRLVFDKALVPPTGSPIRIQSLIASTPETLGTDLANSFTYSLETTNITNDTLKIVENGTVLANMTWYRIQQASGLDAVPFQFDLVTLAGDAFNDGSVDVVDLLDVLYARGQVTDGRDDLDGNGVVETADINDVIAIHMGDLTPNKP